MTQPLSSSEVSAALRSAVEESGYFPALVHDAVMMSTAGEELVSWAVQHEPTITADGIHRHVTVLALTPTRLLINHTDDAEAGAHGAAQAASATEAVALHRVHAVSVTRILNHPEEYATDGATLQEVLVTAAWGYANRIDIEPAQCGDPQCDADHGMTGQLVGDDLMMRMSVDADGLAAAEQLVNFGIHLQRLAGQH